MYSPSVRLLLTTYLYGCDQQPLKPWRQSKIQNRMSMGTVLLAVNGTLMRGLALNRNLLAVGAEFVCEATTAPAYGLWSIGDRHPAMLRLKTGGAAIAVEVWAIPPTGLAEILLQEPPGLCIGKVQLSNGEEVLGVLGEPFLCEGQRNITEWGGWRAYIERMKDEG